MKTTKFIFSKTHATITAGLILGSFLLSFVTAIAAVNPTVETIIRNGNNVTVTTAPVGTNIQAYATISSSTGPVALGTVDFSRFPNTTCSGTPTVESNVLLASGSVNSGTTTLPNTGLSFRVHYDGQTDVYNGVDGNCVSILPISGSVTLGSSLSAVNIYQGGSIYQNSTLSGATSNATGTVNYGVFTNNACTLGKIDGGSKTVANASVPQSNAVTLSTVGTYYFQAQYTGDQYNNSVNGPCQTFTVLATSTTPTPTPGSGFLGGTVYNDLNKNRTKDAGETGIANVTVKLHGGATRWLWHKRSTGVYKTTTTDANGNYSFTGLADGVYGVEEIIPTGWKQISSDFKWILVVNGKNMTGLDFANTAKVNVATNTEKKEQKKAEAIKKLMERIEKIKNR